MKSKVYFIKINDADDFPLRRLKFIRLLDKSKILDFIEPSWQVALKMHFGEEGNTGYVQPGYISEALSRIMKRAARVFLSDTNTLYRGRRLKAADHLRLAREHGFTKETLGLEPTIVDEKKPGAISDITINQRFIQVAKVASLFVQADAIVGVAHFKGHMMTGFGGALKNIGMGCAARAGKLTQHSDIAPFVIMERCTGCGDCEKACSVRAISIVHKKSRIDGKICMGCAGCIAACQYNAIDLHWESGKDVIQQKMVEYAKAVLAGKEARMAFINFAVKITKECDCLAKDDPRISPDVGILASQDPVSIDKASLDLVNQACGKDIFREVQPARNGMIQLLYAAELGLGSLEYELIEI